METRVEAVNEFLAQRHYLGPTRRGLAWSDEFGVCVVAPVTARRLNGLPWFELTRWCLVGTKNGGSRQWKSIAEWLRQRFPELTTVVSYSDPSVGHTGSLYRACNWLWAPTWHRLRTPPTGNGAWQPDKQQAAKDRWVFVLRPDANRERVLSVQDDSLLKVMPWASYREPHGADYQRFKRERLAA